MKRKTPVKLIGYLLCVALLCGLLAGCGNDKVQEEQNDNASADTIPEDVVVHTGYGDLHYPDRWQEYVTIRQEQNGNTIAVTFETKSGEETYELFKVLIGDDSSEVVGSLTDDIPNYPFTDIFLGIYPGPMGGGSRSCCPASG